MGILLTAISTNWDICVLSLIVLRGINPTGFSACFDGLLKMLLSIEKINDEDVGARAEKQGYGAELLREHFLLGN